MITENIWYAENRPIEADIRLSLYPGDWCELKETDAWKEVVRLVEAYESRDTLLRRLEALDLRERLTIEQAQNALDRVPQAVVRNIPHTEEGNTGHHPHPRWRRFLKWIQRDVSGS